MRVASRMDRLGAEEFGTVLAQVSRLRAEGRRVIALHAGEPDFDTPEHISATAIAALRDGQTHYAPTTGIPALRQAVADAVSRSRGIPVDPDQVIIAPGAKPLIYFALLALCQAGDEVLCPDPAYPIYASLASFVGATPVFMPMTRDTESGLDRDALLALITPRTRMIVLNSPSNPTGGVLTRADLETVAEVARSHDLFVLSDEIYSRIVYDGAAESIASISGMAERTIIVDGPSKTYAMTGWRLGYGVLPKTLVPHLARLVLNTLSSTATFLQPAVVAALRGPQTVVVEMVETFRRRRDLIVDGLNRIPGIACARPKGAFYAFPNIAAITHSSAELAEYFLHEAGVATYPGRAFGRRGEGFLRFSFAAAEADITEALERIRTALEKR